MNKRVIVIDTGSESNHTMISDVSKLDYVDQISSVYGTQSRFINTLLRIHFGYKLNKYFDLPFKSIWNRKCVLNSMLADENQEYYVILVNDVIRRFSKTYLHHLKEMNNVHVYILMLDAHDKIKPYFRRCVDAFPSDRIYSFQKSDCEKYGYTYTNTLYSKVDLPEEEEIYDAYFVGEEKDRMEEIWQLFSNLKNRGWSCRFDVITKNGMKDRYPGINFIDHRIPYREILKNIAKTKTIVEICQKGQDGLTMRFYEAVFYNKRLVTNNSTARKHELYNPKWMYVYSDPRQLTIDKDFLTGDVDYQYHDEMSPIHFIEQVISYNSRILT